MLDTIIAAFFIFLLAVLGMALGVIVQGKRISGSCGGLGGIDGSDHCGICGRSCERRKRGR